MSKKKYDEGKVINQLASRGITIDYVGHYIQVPKDGTVIVGIHTWGKIDYLVNYCGWRCVGVMASELQKQRAAERLAKKQEKAEAKAKYKEKKKLNKR